MLTRFRNRIDAGERLAKRLGAYAGRPDVLVLALPRGGVPVALEVAAQLTHRSTCSWFASSEYPAARSWPWVPSPREGFAYLTTTWSGL